jgi:hypothetical protein
MRKLLLILAFLFFAAEIGADRCLGQSWSGILSPSRAIDWSSAGLPNPLPDGEATANPWTPPVRTLCTSVTGTNTAPTDQNNIVAAVSGCGPGTYVALHGTFSITSTMRLGGTNTNFRNNVTLRGDGAMSTIINLGSSGSINIGAVACCSAGNLTNTASNFTRYQTSFILENVTGTGDLTTAKINAGLVVGHFMQCDNGYTPTTRPLAYTTSPLQCSGSAVDTNSIFFCSGDPYCASSSQQGVFPPSEGQTVRITGAVNNGNGTWTVTTSPGLYMPDWSYARGATLSWLSTTYTTTGMGVEDMTLNGAGGIVLGNGTASWMKGVRVVGYSNNGTVATSYCSHCLIANSYFFGSGYTAGALGNLYADAIGDPSGDVLLVNNIGQASMFSDDGGSHEGIVMAYNYSRDVTASHYQSTEFEHRPGSSFVLREGNQFGRVNDDGTWGTHNLETVFRNNGDCGDYPFQIPGQSGGGIQVGSWARFENLIGNVIGIGIPSSYLTNKCAQYSGQATDTYAFNINGTVGSTDGTGLTEASLVRWGNVTTILQSSDTPANSGIRFVASENSNNGNLSSWPNAVPYANMASPSTTLPCSMFIPGTATNCTPKYSGGTGLSWWKVCDTWTTFPTSCAHYTTPPFPATGPDILASGGAPANYANDIPAKIAWKNLPIDTSLQTNYTITASSWSGGIETLTVSSLPVNTYNLQGPFQLTGTSTNNCYPNATPQELVMTGATSTTISYALTSNPGTNACVGTMKYPDMRQFDERVYASDPSGTTAANPNPPSGLSATVQ